MDPIDSLLRFGLTRQEATLYAWLCREGPKNGYEAAKETGISRSNAYSALASLADKGAVDTEEGTPVRYIAVSPQTFCGAHIRALDRLTGPLSRALTRRIHGEDPAYLTVRGTPRILSKMEEMLDDAGERVYLALPSQLLESLIPRLEDMLHRGCRVVILGTGVTLLPGAEWFQVNRADNRVRMIVDSSVVLTGSLDGAPPTCLCSRDIHLVDLIKEALRSEMKRDGNATAATGEKV